MYFATLEPPTVKLVEFTVINISLYTCNYCCRKAIRPFHRIYILPEMTFERELGKEKKAIRLSKGQFTIQIGLFWNRYFQGKILHTVALNIVNMHILLQAIRLTVHQGISKNKWPFFTKLNLFSGTSASATLANGTNTVHSEDDHLYTSSLSLFIKARLGFSYFNKKSQVYAFTPSYSVREHKYSHTHSRTIH